MLGISPKIARNDKTLHAIERLKRERESRRRSIEEFKRRRADESKANELKGKPGDVDFQRMIKNYRFEKVDEPLPHSSVGDLKINVVVRKRPVSEMEIRKKDYDSITCNNPTVHVHNCKFRVDGITKYLETTKFNVDHAFGEESTNTEVYEFTAKPLVSFALNGGRATCFAYGQTGSGKTFTMAGVQSIAAEDIFQRLANDRSMTVCVAFFELYGGRCIDLLHDRTNCMIREDGKGVVHIEGLSEIEVDNSEELLELIRQGNEDRTTHATEMNNVSSRSHAICQIAFRKKNSSSKEPFGKLSLIDLAGSERGQDTKQHCKVRRKESAEINKSLLALKECIRALDNTNNGNGAHVPYRVSKLTMVLKDSFSSDAKTVMISCVSPVSSSTDHTLNTLRYADRVKEKKATPPQKLPSSKALSKRRQTLNFTPSVKKTDSKTDSGRLSVYNHALGSNSDSLNSLASKDIKSRNSDPVVKDNDDSYSNENDVSFDLSMEIDEEITNFEVENTDQSNNSFSGDTSLKEKSTRNMWGSVKQLDSFLPPKKEREVKQSSLRESSYPDEADEKLAQIDFKELVARLVEEEDEILDSHLRTIERNKELLAEETKMLQTVRGTDVMDYDIDSYTTRIEEIVLEKLSMYDRLYQQIKTFKQNLSMEEVHLK